MLNNACFTPFPNLCQFKMLDSIYWHVFFRKQGKWKRCGSGSASSLTPSELDLQCFQDMIYHAPNFEKVEGAYCFGLVCPSVLPSVTSLR